jgi:beta-glucosidase/6-phospho-beta-glucosidase/beta-galactosidase
MAGFEPLGDAFYFGVANAGFQVEGGYNGPGEPKNQWSAWEEDGKVEPSGSALDFWHRYGDHFDRAASLGCNSFRLSVEWARVEPEPGRIDKKALRHYEKMLATCRDRGLTPLVTLHHFCHPSWLGDKFWLDPASPGKLRDWMIVAVDALGQECSMQSRASSRGRFHREALGAWATPSLRSTI